MATSRHLLLGRDGTGCLVRMIDCLKSRALGEKRLTRVKYRRPRDVNANSGRGDTFCLRRAESDAEGFEANDFEEQMVGFLRAIMKARLEKFT